MALPWLDPANPSLMIPLVSLTDRIDLSAIFPRSQPLEIELGSGDGSFMAHYARQHPEKNFLAIERLLGRIRKLNRKGLRTGLENLRLARIEAGYFVQYLLPAECASALHIYFPDPWPKKRHHRNRLINEAFTHLVRTLLIPTGRIFIRTDDADYHEWMLKAFASNRHFKAIETPAELREITTDFERDFNQRGIPTRYAAYERIG